MRRFAIATTALVSLALPGAGWSVQDPAGEALEPGQILIDDLGDRSRQDDAAVYAWRIYHAQQRWIEHYNTLRDPANAADLAALVAAYATPRSAFLAHLPGMTANDVTFLDSLGIRFRVTAVTQTDPDGSTWDDHTIEVYASSTALRRAVTASDIVALGADFNLHFGTWNVGGDLRVGMRRQLPRGDIEYDAPKVFLERQPCPAGEWGSGVFTERTVQPDGTATVRETSRRCGPSRSMSYMTTMDCVNGVEGGIFIRETVTRERDPNDPYGHIRRVSSTVVGDICDLNGTGATATQPQSRILVANVPDPTTCAHGVQTQGYTKTYLLTLTSAVQGRRYRGNDVTGRRLEDVVTNTVCNPPPTPTPQQFTVIGDDGREETVWGWDLDGDGDLDTSNPLDVQDDDGNVVYRPPDGDCGGGCWDDGDDSDNNGGGCFLTTAVVSMRGEADDGPTLSVLRAFRDRWLAGTAEGRAMIEQYYAIAPRIVAAIPAGNPEWDWIADRVDAARDAITAGQYDLAFAVYAAMVRTLERRWL